MSRKRLGSHLQKKGVLLACITVPLRTDILASFSIFVNGFLSFITMIPCHVNHFYLLSQCFFRFYLIHVDDFYVFLLRFLVDETPVRVHTNMEKHGLPFPKDQPMGVYSSIWNADDWATQGGRVKTDWSHAPFIASYKGFEIDACECPIAVAADDNAKRCSSSGEKRYWWDEPTLAELNLHQSHQLLWVRANHMVYDYCTDSARFPATPVECQHHRH